MFCWSPAALLLFPTKQVREGAGCGQATCTCDHTSICNQAWVTVRLIYEVSTCGKQQHGLVQKPPSPLLFFYPLGKRIWHCFGPYWLVFRAPSPITLPIPQAFLCLSCHALFSSPVSASNVKVFLTFLIQCSAEFVFAIFSVPTFEFEGRTEIFPPTSYSSVPLIALSHLHLIQSYFLPSPLLQERWLRKYLNP